MERHKYAFASTNLRVRDCFTTWIRFLLFVEVHSQPPSPSFPCCFASLLFSITAFRRTNKIDILLFFYDIHGSYVCFSFLRFLTRYLSFLVISNACNAHTRYSYVIWFGTRYSPTLARTHAHAYTQNANDSDFIVLQWPRIASIYHRRWESISIDRIGWPRPTKRHGSTRMASTASTTQTKRTPTTRKANTMAADLRQRSVYRIDFVSSKLMWGAGNHSECSTTHHSLRGISSHHIKSSGLYKWTDGNRAKCSEIFNQSFICFSHFICCCLG